MPNTPFSEQPAAAAVTPLPAAAPLVLPEPGSVWVHKGGALYTVLVVTTEPDEDKADEFPVTVLYLGTDGRKWARPLTRWQERMTKVATSEFVPNTLMSFVHIALLQWDVQRKARRAKR